MTRKRALLPALALALAAPAAAVEVLPVYKGGLMGGQYFLGGAKSSLSGNANLLAAPVLKFSERWSFIPLYSGNYQGTKGVGDGTGAGTLYQQEMDHRASATGIYTPEASTWKLKPSLSYKREFLKETLDEEWGHGLFDYEKIGLGFEAENVYKDPFSYRFGLDVYRIRFPNFSSLESGAGTDPQGNPLGRENSSRNVLDTMNYQFSFSASRPVPYEDPKVSVQVGLSSLYQHYSDQRLVNSQGSFTDHKPYSRQDFLQTVTASVIYPRALRIKGDEYRLSSGVNLSAAYNGSNQNTFDAGSATFVFDSYSYYSYGMGPSFTLAWGDKKRPTSATASFLYNRTQYVGRLAQNASGAYTAERQYEDRYTFSLGYQYPVSAGFYLKAQSNFQWETSNQAFQTTYLYTYRTANYLLGFTYEY